MPGRKTRDQQIKEELTKAHQSAEEVQTQLQLAARNNAVTMAHIRGAMAELAKGRP